MGLWSRYQIFGGLGKSDCNRNFTSKHGNYMIAYGIGRHMRTRLPFNFKPTAPTAGITTRLLAAWEALESTSQHVGTACQTRPHINVDTPSDVRKGHSERRISELLRL